MVKFMKEGKKEPLNSLLFKVYSLGILGKNKIVFEEVEFSPSLAFCQMVAELHDYKSSNKNYTINIMT